MLTCFIFYSTFYLNIKKLCFYKKIPKKTCYQLQLRSSKKECQLKKECIKGTLMQIHLYPLGKIDLTLYSTG